MAVTVQLAPCVRTILCGLSNATLSALRGVIDTQIAQLNILIASIEAKLTVLNILTIPVQAAANLLEETIAQVKAAANLVPLNLIGNCVDLSNFSLGLNTALDALTADIEDQERDLIRLLSVTKELQFLKLQYTALLEQFNAVIEVLATCGSTG